MADVIVVFRKKPKSCSECIGKSYCAVKKPKSCPIKSIPTANASKIDDDYCVGWDRVVSVITNLISDPEEKKRRFFLPVNYEQCRSCKNKFPSRGCCSLISPFRDSLDAQCFSEGQIIDICRGLDYSFDPTLAERTVGFNDGLQWILEQLEFKKHDENSEKFD